MTDDTKRVDLNDSTQPEAVSSNAGAAPESKQGEFSAQPEAAEILEKSVQPAGVKPPLDPEGIGASTQPEIMPLTTQQASPPPADED